MRRQDVQLLALARQGDLDALCEVGQRYLQGVQGFPQYTDLGLKYLSHPALSTSERSARIIAESLSLSDLVRRDLVPVLVSAASAGSSAACLKLVTAKKFEGIKNGNTVASSLGLNIEQIKPTGLVG